MLKLAHERTFHNLTTMQLNRHVQESAGHHNIRKHDRIGQLVEITSSMKS